MKLRRLEAFVFRAPIEVPVQTSFGLMKSRPALLIRAEESGGDVGWGEVWCNFPSVGAEHRARLLESVVAPMVLAQEWAHPSAAYEKLTRQLQVLAIQCGEPGTIAQVIAGVDIALWDLHARLAGEPIWRLLGGKPSVKVYASGLNPTAPEQLASTRLTEGYRAFKLKVGFGVERDLANLQAMREAVGEDSFLMVDANQAWTPGEAGEMSRRMEPFRPHWLEEPIRADRPWSEWKTLAETSPIPLAAGENLRGDDFEHALDSGALAVIQPDIGKWGGFSGCLPVARRIIEKGRLYCPHWLGAGIGLAASLQLKAGVGGEGMVEVDANPNPLRERLGSPVSRVCDGVLTLTDEPGIGITPDLHAAKEFLALHLSVTR